MTRRLLNFEVAVLIEAGAYQDRDTATSQQVWREYHAPPHLKGRQWFNTDFVIELDNWDQSERPKPVSVPIRPNTLGADFFIMLTADRIPTMLELLEGESISRKSFNEDISQIAEFVDNLRHVPIDVAVTKAPYLRIARLQRCIAFVVATTTAIFDLLNSPSLTIEAEENAVAYRSVRGELLIDGVLYD
jgi:hypothetical protein